jgi:hypothetical protein
MIVAKLRRGLLLSLVALALICLASPAGAEPLACLSSHIGEILSERLAAHAFDGALPAGWTIEEVGVAKDHIDLGTLDDQRRPRGVALRMPGDARGTPDGRGHWFVFVIDAGPAPLDATGRRGLLELAARVDAAVPEDEALRICIGGPAEGRSWAERGGPLPRWVALSVGAFEGMVVLAGLAFARGRRGGVRTGAKARARAVWFDLAVLVLAWMAFRVQGGGSPALWLDTINDQRDVKLCLVQGACTSLGEAASVDGVYHAVGWLDFLDLTAFAGLGLGTLHLLLQAFNAIGVMLVAAQARQAWGRAAGLFAAAVCLVWTDKAVSLAPVYNTTALPFLGAVFLVVSVAAARRPGPASIALTAMVGAVLASVHSACVVTLVSVVWVALLAPRRRAMLAAVGTTVFVGTALAIGPAAWLVSAHHVLSAVTSPRSHHVAAGDSAGALWTYATLAALSLAARLASPPRHRPLLDVALAIALPVLAGSVAAAATSTVSTNTKYLAHVIPSGAVLAAALVVAASTRIAGVLARSASSFARAGAAALAVLLVMLALPGLRHRVGPLLEPRARSASLTFDDAEAIPRALAAHGWTFARAYRSLRSPDAAVILASFETLAPHFPLGPAPDDPTVVYVAKVDAAALPRPLPESWEVANQVGGSAVVLAFTQSFLSWEHFRVCDPRGPAGQDNCADSGLSIRGDEKPKCLYCVPGMPPCQRPGEHAMELHLPVRSTEGEAHAIVMPARLLLCSGSIASVPGGPAAVSADRRRATWVEPTSPDSPGEVTLEWTIGSQECDMNAYSGLPPFFLEGDPRTVEQLERLGM